MQRAILQISMESKIPGAIKIESQKINTALPLCKKCLQNSGSKIFREIVCREDCVNCHQYNFW